MQPRSARNISALLQDHAYNLVIYSPPPTVQSGKERSLEQPAIGVYIRPAIKKKLDSELVPQEVCQVKCCAHKYAFGIDIGPKVEQHLESLQQGAR
jgi:hypothetical protein